MTREEARDVIGALGISIAIKTHEGRDCTNWDAAAWMDKISPTPARFCEAVGILFPLTPEPAPAASPDAIEGSNSHWDVV